jgi:hypothetical protein
MQNNNNELQNNLQTLFQRIYQKVGAAEGQAQFVFQNDDRVVNYIPRFRNLQY